MVEVQGVGSAYRGRAVLGVQFSDEVDLFENLGTVRNPIEGDPLDLSTFPVLSFLARVDRPGGERIREASVFYVFDNPARIEFIIDEEGVNKARVGNELFAIRWTVIAFTSSGKARVVLDGVIDVRDSGSAVGE